MVSPRWVKSMSQEEHNESDSELAIRDDGFDSNPNQHGGNAHLEGKVASLEEEVQMLRKLLLEHSSDLARLLAATSTDKDEDEDEFRHFLALALPPGQVALQANLV